MIRPQHIYRADYAVIGSGIAGLRAAIELSTRGAVLVVAKSDLGDSATARAQGGVAVALSDDDEVALHAQDTIDAGDGLCRSEAVALLVQEGPQCINQLIEWGAEFDRNGTELAFTREAAHSRSRILHAHGDSTGKEISRALVAHARTIPRIHLLSHAFSTELLLESGAVAGFQFIDERDGTLCEVRSPAVLLATGGLGQIYRETTNPGVATGDGMAIAYHAGAVLSDMEFTQFHPTALAVRDAPRFLISEALRGEGGVLRNVLRERFMDRYDQAQELAPRDVVSRAIVSEMGRTDAGHVFLDMTMKSPGFLKKRFPLIYETCLHYGLELSTDLIPVSPAAHYMMGGVKTDLWGHTSVPGLYAAGETAATGVHGANRLASNSLLEGLVFGARSGRAMLRDFPAAAAHHSSLPKREQENPVRFQKQAVSVEPTHSSTLAHIREIMWQNVGIVRTANGLQSAQSNFEAMDLQPSEKTQRAEQELHNLRTLAILMARSALARRESRGSHYRTDFPQRNDREFQKHSVVAKGGNVRFEG